MAWSASTEGGTPTLEASCHLICRQDPIASEAEEAKEEEEKQRNSVSKKE